MKSELGLRPIYHQLGHRVEANILVAFLAYCLLVTLKNRLQVVRRRTIAYQHLAVPVPWMLDQPTQSIHSADIGAAPPLPLHISRTLPTFFAYLTCLIMI